MVDPPGRAARDRRRVRRRLGRAGPRVAASTRRRCSPTSRWSSTARCPTTRSVSTRPARRRPARTSPTRRSARAGQTPVCGNTGPRNNTGTSRGAAPPPAGATSVSTYFSANGDQPVHAHRSVSAAPTSPDGRVYYVDTYITYGTLITASARTKQVSVVVRDGSTAHGARQGSHDVRLLDRQPAECGALLTVARAACR